MDELEMSDAAKNKAAAIHAAREHNTLALIHRKLSNENLCDIFLALAYLDTPSLENSQGWYLQVNGVCHLWRKLAVHCAELWSRSDAGSFPSRRPVNPAIEPSGASLINLDGHLEVGAISDIATNDAAINEAAIRAAGEHNALALIHRKLLNENLCDIFLTLSYLDTPSLENPQGRFLQVNGVCHLWRELAVHHAELWARSAGSFTSMRMTDLAIQRAGASLLSLDGHFEDHEGPGYVLTDYQLWLFEKHAVHLQSFVHDHYMAWSELFYRLKTFPELKKARIWDDSGTNEWFECVDAPRLQCLYMNNALIPFNAPALRYLRVDMDNHYWSSRRDLYGSYETESDAEDPTMFPTREFIAFLQRSSGLEQLIVTDMPVLLQEHLPLVSDFHAELPNLRALHLGGNSGAMGDFWQRLWIPLDVQIFIDTDYLNGQTELYAELQGMLTDRLNSPLYDSLRLSMSSVYDLVLQMWSSETRNALALELSASLELFQTTQGSALTIRLPVGTRDLLETWADRPIVIQNAYTPFWKRDHFLLFQNDMAEDFYRKLDGLLRFFRPSTLKHFDLAGMPFVVNEFVAASAPDSDILESLFPLYSSEPNASVSRRGSVVIRWTVLEQIFTSDRSEYVLKRLGKYFPPFIEDITLVDFPCASFPSHKRYDEYHNAKAWNILWKILQERSVQETHSGRNILSLRLAESTAEVSNMERSEEPEYEHIIIGSYEDAVRSVTERYYQYRVAPFVSSFEDLRINTWP